eukprot:6194739-Pleurochrysis_carterae.AAC.2
MLAPPAPQDSHLKAMDKLRKQLADERTASLRARKAIASENALLEAECSSLANAHADITSILLNLSNELEKTTAEFERLKKKHEQLQAADRPTAKAARDVKASGRSGDEGICTAARASL